MLTVAEAEKIVSDNLGYFGAEIVMFDKCGGRVLAETIKADRDLPPYNRITMDGIAVRYEALQAGVKEFNIVAVQAAGDEPATVSGVNDCVEVMTGGALPLGADTVIRYEDVTINGDIARIDIDNIMPGQFIHAKGTDKQAGDVLAVPGQYISPALVSVIASVGEEEVRVAKLPFAGVFSTGNELVDVAKTPGAYQIRKSNSYAVQAALNGLGVEVVVGHCADDDETIKNQLEQALSLYNVIVLTGGVSAGKFDLIPKVLADLGVTCLFHKVAQRPGKPFWFGKHPNGVTVFALPGNPVSVYTCLYRYVLPWIKASLGLKYAANNYAVLDADVNFSPALSYFIQVKVTVGDDGRQMASPIIGNGSGDFANLADADALMELPAEKSQFLKGEVYRIYPLN